MMLDLTDQQKALLDRLGQRAQTGHGIRLSSAQVRDLADLIYKMMSITNVFYRSIKDADTPNKKKKKWFRRG